MYKIGELSKICRIPVKTLRFYDTEGLLIPDYIDKFTGYRYYSAEKAADCNRIIALKELGFSLSEIRQYMNSGSLDEITDILDSKLSEIKRAAEVLESQRKKLEKIRHEITEGENKMFEVIVKKNEFIHAAGLRKIFSAKEKAYEEIENIKKSLPKNIIGRKTFIINYETEYCENDFDLSVCVEITGKLPAGCGLQEISRETNGDIASLVCKFNELDEAYQYMTRRLDEDDYQIIGAYYEVYHEDGITELNVPVYKRTNEAMIKPENDKLLFENDAEAIGHWNMIDIVPSREQFLYGHPKCGHRGWLDEIYFLDDGKEYWGVAGWTKGKLYTYGKKIDSYYTNKYEIFKENDRALMFLEMNSCLDGKGQNFGMPEIWVYEKDSDKHFTIDEIRKKDNIDLPFISDDEILGKWTVHDFYVNKPKDYDPAEINWNKDDLFCLSFEFLPGGECIHTTKQHESRLKWTKGFIINKSSITASAYEIKHINGKDYLITEWKTGDYQFGDGRIYYYIYKRV